VSRAANPQLSFADWEFLRQGVVLERELQAIADFLDNHEEMVEAIRGDLRRGLKSPDTGRKGLSPQQVLRSLILMRVKNWDYRELRERVADGLTLRRFTDFNAQPVPKHDAFQRAFSRVTPQTLKRVNDLLIKSAVAMGLEDGSKLRVDTTVVQTDIHHPTDNTLLWDVVRVVTRLVRQLATAIERPIKGFRHRTRAARRRMQALQRMTPTQRQAHSGKNIASSSASPTKSWSAPEGDCAIPAKFAPRTRLPSWPSTNCAARSNITVISESASSIRRVVVCSRESRFPMPRRSTRFLNRTPI
jgi:IS5 family transposase